uniref:HAD-superfamily hydrolase n=1 Tax=uncultured bacterium W5-47b TaxID=1130998 RepID=H9BX34_9BACT|nr:HAD-superfamily hydrolase [uncultured bacterium W5-47b]
MIKAIIFDLDGTLVQTEILKAHSYGRALEQLSNGRVNEDNVVNSFKELVGLSRNEVAKKLIEQYGDNIVRDHIESENESLPELLIERRLNIYHNILSDPAILPKYSCRHNIKLLKTVMEKRFKTGLATMSNCEQVKKVLKIIKLEDHFDCIITRDEVNNAKPDPEIYLKMLEKLKVDKKEAIIIEDSVSGIKAALAAGIIVFAVTNSLTRDKVNNSRIIDSTFIINDRRGLIKKILLFISHTAG